MEHTLSPEVAYVIEELLGFQPPDSVMHLALIINGYVDLLALCTMTPQDIQELTSAPNMQEAQKQARGESEPMIKRHKSLLRTGIQFIHQELFQKLGRVPMTADVLLLKKNDFNAFRLTLPFNMTTTTRSVGTTSSLAATAANTIGSSPSSNQSMHGLLDMEVSVSPFTSLNKSEEWPLWEKTTISLAKAMGIGDIFDVSFNVPAPGTPDRNKFELQQRLAYPILLTKVKTDHGKGILTQSPDGDAHAVFKALKTHYEASIASDLVADELMKYLTTAKFGQVTFAGGARQFILHWQKQLRLLDDITPVNQRFPLALRKRLLANAVVKVDALQHVSDTEKILRAAQAAGGTNTAPLPYETYCELLLAAATNYDAAHPSVSGRRSRSIRSTEIDYQHDASEDVDYIPV